MVVVCRFVLLLCLTVAAQSTLVDWGACAAVFAAESSEEIVALQESSPEVSPAPSEKMENAPAPPAELTPAERERRKNFLAISWILLIGVGILGALLLIIVFVLGATIRRRTRISLPAAPLRDPFWYLKPSREGNSSKQPPASSQQTESE